VKKVQKGEGLMLKGTASETYTIPSTGVQAIYMNMIVGNVSGDAIDVYETSEDGEWTNYYLKGGTYMSVKGNVSIGNNKSYLQLPTSMLAGARGEDASDIPGNVGMPGTCQFVELEVESMPIVFQNTTGMRPTPNPSLNGGEWYDLQGRKYDSRPTKKGFYIKNGKKYVVK
jgi:hypothetical protein